MRAALTITTAAMLFALASACGDATSATPPTDAGTPANDAAVASDVRDELFADAAPSCDGACCVACNAACFTPSYKSANAPRPVCSQALIDEYYAGCLAPLSTQQTCAPFGNQGDAAHRACATCIATPDTAATLGPVVTHPGFVALNLAGCIEREDPSAAGLSCAQAYSALEACEEYACTGSCFVCTDDTCDARVAACRRNVDEAGCNRFVTPATCATAEGDSGPAAQCLRGQSFKEGYDAIVPVFCLAPGDGGRDAAAD